MKKMIMYFGFVLLFGGVLLLACSNNKEAESEIGPIEKITGKTAKEVVNRIRTPINKAHSVKDRQEDRWNSMDESVKKEEP